MSRKLKQLINCDIYRDGGSLSGKWLDSENNEWFLTLLINHWEDPNETKTYRLFNCGINQTNNYSQIIKNSVVHQEMNELIEHWVIENQINMETLKKETKNHNRLYDLLQEFKKGNY